MLDDKEIWAVEWHPIEKQIHIQSLSQTIEGNLRYILNGDGNKSWLLVGIAETEEQASKIADRVEKEFG